jgi:hypothetical protein
MGSLVQISFAVLLFKRKGVLAMKLLPIPSYSQGGK